MTVKKEIRKIAEMLDKQQKILTKLAQQVIDTSRSTTNPMDKFVHDATLAWSLQTKLSARSKFDAGTDGKNYEVDVTLGITDPKRPIDKTPAAQAVKESYRQSFLAVLQSMFSKESQNSASPLFGSKATFKVIVEFPTV